MGRRKGSKNKKKKTVNSVQQKKTIGSDFLGGILIALSLILLIMFKIANIGAVGDFVNNTLSGLFGGLKYVLPVVFGFVGAKLIVSDKKYNVWSELAKGLLVVITLSALVYVFTSTRFDMSENMVSYINWAYSGGKSGTVAAGMVGALVGGLAELLGGVVIARVILVILSLLFTLYFVNLSLRNLIAIIYNIFAAIFEFIANAFVTVFNKEEKTENQEKEDQKDDKKKNKEEKAKELEKLKMESAKLETVGTRNYAGNIKSDDDQLEFKLDNIQDPGKEKRDEFFKKQKEINDEKNVKEVLQLKHNEHEEDVTNYIFPPISLLNENKSASKGMNKKQIDSVADKLEATLKSFGVDAKVTNITKGPTVVCYELTPAPGVKVSRIVGLTDDIALNLAAKSIRIEAPIPGKGTVGIEVPTENKEMVGLREIIDAPEFDAAKSKLAFALGKDTAGNIKLGDIAKMPHVLVAGSTGSGKSVCINAMLVSMLYKAKPSEVKLILIDPKMVELTAYNGIPHLLIPVVTDPKKAAGALNWAVSEMIGRYTSFAAKGVKDLEGYNKLMEAEEGKKMPQIVIVIDELSDLMMAAPNDVEDAICRLAQMARAAGMYLVIATQRPSVDVITGVIKANIPSRIAFTVSSQVDSRTIIDQAGAEKLLGKGDMLYYPTGEIKPLRMQGAFVSEKEVEDVVTFIKGNSTARYNEDIIEKIDNAGKGNEVGSNDTEDDVDTLLDAAIDLVVDMGTASASMLQRRFKIGYSRAGRMIDQMEARGIVSGYEGSKPRQVLVSKEEWQELKLGTYDAVPTAVSHEEVLIPENNIKEKVNNIASSEEMERIRKSINMDSMFYDEDENSPNNT